jgi:hypothetical protein
MVASEMMMPKTLPGGGLASFLTSNMDEIDDSVLAFGRPSGINSMRDVAERMAQMGRGGDNFIVHASEREMLVPREVVENNPQLRQQIMQGIAAEGANPNAYVVGNQANSINPMTGQREFFLKKLVSGIKNVVKNVAPIVLPIALNVLFPGMGTVAAGALGSGIGTLIQGGNIKDAFKSALIGGAAGGLYSGISGAMRGQGFMAGVREGLIGQPNMRFFELNPSVRSFFGGAPQAAAPAPPVAETASQPTWFDRLLGRTPDSTALTGETRLAEINRLATEFPNVEGSEIVKMVDGAQPTMLQRFGPTVAGGLALGAVTGAFNPVEQEAPATPGYDTTSQELLAANPELYRVGTPGAPQYLSLADIAVPTGGSSVVPPAPIMALPPLTPIRRAAAGGEMESFPRRMGAISGPGTETSDAVPAMLSDGEFVMTARAVRGAGNGDRERGVRRMYDMMRMFEGGVAR